ncbi:putative Histone-lysine N-methyltransferase ATX4 [Cocos nucifera]|uniref:Putative Histone-lysine N-methyltransferase ATX4 n=1 Tax=Cocos nucifera TaxID=13894 RepID=A0A8K0IBB9_COCNU|nr:putative Histone-lysine N-methyltransferase ATX4 [Cocos nucifera]
MPTLKRCNAEGAAPGEEDGERRRKRRREDGFFPLEVLGIVSAAGFPAFPFGFKRPGGDVQEKMSSAAVASSWCTEVSYGSGEVESESRDTRQKERDRLHLPEEVAPPRARPPVVRTSRGRVQVLPSRFNDSVLIDPWKKEKPKAKALDPDFAIKTDLMEPKKQGFIHKDSDFSSAFANSITLFDEEERYWACRNLKFKKNSSSRSTLTSLNESSAGVEKWLPPAVDVEFPLVYDSDPMTVETRMLKESIEQRKDFYWPEEFVLGDIVWAKLGKKYPAWPAIVVNPMQQSPEAVPQSSIPGAVCVMFFGYSGNGNDREYAWVKEGMIFPFLDYVDRFQGQTKLHKSKPSDFRLAIEEAFIAEYGFLGVQVGGNDMAGQPAYHQSFPRGIQEATNSNHDQECQSEIQARSPYFTEAPSAIFLSSSLSQNDSWGCGFDGDCYAVNKSGMHSESCGLILPIKNAKKMKQKPKRLVCRYFAKHLSSKQCCGICKKIWHHKDGGKLDMEDSHYLCPDCKAKLNFESSDTEKKHSESRCLLIMLIKFCKCGQNLMSMWLLQGAEKVERYQATIVSANHAKRPSPKKHMTQFMSDGQRNDAQSADGLRTGITIKSLSVTGISYNHVDPKPILRCQIAVHQECYGMRGKQDFTSWVCRACETPEEKRECCLCPVKGGALKPTDVDAFWVHVTCAWFQPQVSFASDEIMEPAVGILNIPSESFVKVKIWLWILLH